MLFLDLWFWGFAAVALPGFWLPWLEHEARELGLPYLDYSSLLATSDFIDSIHPTREGKRKIAVQLARDLAPYLELPDPTQ